MINQTTRYLSAIIVLSMMIGCTTTETKREAFPQMYDPGKRPVSILVLPALNESTAAEALSMPSRVLKRGGPAK